MRVGKRNMVWRLQGDGLEVRAHRVHRTSLSRMLDVGILGVAITNSGPMGAGRYEWVRCGGANLSAVPSCSDLQNSLDTRLIGQD